jgi:hypothetical protein
MDIKEIVETYGIKNVRVFTEMPVCQSLHKFGLPIGITDREKMVMTECQIVESRYKVAEGYKLTLQPVNPGDGEPLYAGSEHYYQCDFNNMRRRNPDAFKIYILVDEDGRYERLREQIAA